ncbi:NAD(P)-dependent oxidoreductase [Nocardia sp. SSK8]|uniref:NAD(P)-dependent oxidoreductase n=1 Tax=Nocardia sp. SSK8 TaxID=3120154 RepID=UPI003009E23F
MRVTVFGATGATGRLVVDRALAEGHEVTVVARRTGPFDALRDRVGVIEAELTDASAIREGVHGSDVVISALGTQGRAATTVYSAGVATMLAAMADTGTRRIVAVSATPAAPAAQQNAVDRYVLHPIVSLFFGGAFADMARMEQVLVSSDAEWTALRPSRLTDAPATGSYRTAIDAPLHGAKPLARADLAAALLDAAAKPEWFRHAVTIAR